MILLLYDFACNMPLALHHHHHHHQSILFNPSNNSQKVGDIRLSHDFIQEELENESLFKGHKYMKVMIGDRF